MNEILTVTIFIILFFSPVFYQLFLVIKENKDETKVLLKKLRKYLIYTVLSFIPIATFFLILNQINFINYKSPMPYSQIELIKLSDFKGFEFFKKTLYGNERFAYIYTSIEYEINDNSMVVESFFHPSRSFVYNEHTNNKDLLTHELYHFKITEIYTRKIKQKIDSLNHWRIMKNIKILTKDEIKQIIKEMNLYERLYQRKYDYDTFHSYVYKEQKKYEKKIDSLLLLLNEYKEPKIYIDVKN